MYKSLYKLKYRMVGVLPIWIVNSNVSSSDQGPTHRPFYISICISTLPTQHTYYKPLSWCGY